MKKIISFITACTLTASLTATASASGFVKSMNTAEANHNSDSNAINIIYNGQLLTYTDAFPENINDRVMLPFRAVLEGMGAKVDYEEASRLVTAKRGGKTITFTLEDDTIYIDDDGEKSEITMDVPMIIKNDRTLVPVRFISNALGMQIGWEGDYNTVLIVDSESYAEDLEKAAPNLAALFRKNPVGFNTSSLDLSIQLDAAETGGDAVSASAGMKLSSEEAEDISHISGTVSLDIGELGVSTAPVNNAAIEIISADGKIYIKTDLIEKLFDSEYSSPVTDVLKDTITGDRWFFVDLEELADKLLDGETEEVKELYSRLLSGEMSSEISIEDIFGSVSAADDATLMSAMTTDMMFDAYRVMDKYITVTDNKVEMKITQDNIGEIFEAMGISEITSDEEIKEFTNPLTFDVYALSEYGEANASSRADITLGIKDESAEFLITLNISETDEQKENVSPASVPENAIDLINIIELLSQ